MFWLGGPTLETKNQPKTHKTSHPAGEFFWGVRLFFRQPIELAWLQAKELSNSGKICACAGPLLQGGEREKGGSASAVEEEEEEEGDVESQSRCRRFPLRCRRPGERA